MGEKQQLKWNGDRKNPQIIYEDEALLIAYKPAGLATQTAKVGQPDLVSELTKRLFASQRRQTTPPYLGLVHRLDQPVEGLLVFGKTKKATAQLCGQLESCALKKSYRAVFCGRPACQRGELVDYLIKDKHHCARAVTGREKEYPEAKRAILQYTVVAKRVLQEKLSAEDTGVGLPEICVADIQIETGRFHQIRCQMAHAGLPLLGDLKYGSPESIAVSRSLGIQSVALCACQLTLRHPVTGREISFAIEPANEMQII